MNTAKPPAQRKTSAHILGSLSAAALLLLSSCEAIDLVTNVGSILGPVAESAAKSAEKSRTADSEKTDDETLTAEQTQPVVETPVLSIQKSTDPTPVSTDWNLARGQGVGLTVSSSLNATFAKERLLDGKLTTSWFSSDSDSPKQGKLPTIELSFEKPVGVLSINLRGDREREKGLNIQELSLLLTSTQGILLNETLELPPNANDVNLVLNKPVDATSSLRLTITRAEEAPGLAEIEVLGIR